MIEYYTVGEYIEVWDVHIEFSHQWVPLKPRTILLKSSRVNTYASQKRQMAAAHEILIDGYVTDCNKQVAPILLSSLQRIGLADNSKDYLYVYCKHSDLKPYAFSEGIIEFDAAIMGDVF